MLTYLGQSFVSLSIIDEGKQANGECISTFLYGVYFLRMISVLFKVFPENSVLLAFLNPPYPTVNGMLFVYVQSALLIHPVEYSCHLVLLCKWTSSFPSLPDYRSFLRA